MFSYCVKSIIRESFLLQINSVHLLINVHTKAFDSLAYLFSQGVHFFLSLIPPLAHTLLSYFSDYKLCLTKPAKPPNQLLFAVVQSFNTLH